jgi:SepF-like predicted cell division protein (DUF552 family)
MGFFSKIKEKLQGPSDEDMYGEAEEEYVELDTEMNEVSSKVMIRPFILNDFEDTKPILDALRKGKTIGLINIKPLKEKDIVELKRSINKLKKTCDAIDGEIAGFGEDYIVVTPSFAEIYKAPKAAPVAAPKAEEFKSAPEFDDSME